MFNELKRRFHVAIVIIACMGYYHISNPKSEFAVAQSTENPVTLPKIKEIKLLTNITLPRDPFLLGEMVKIAEVSRGGTPITGVSLSQQTPKQVETDGIKEGGKSIGVEEATIVKIISKPTMPYISIDGIIYSENKKNRFVSLNGQMMEEGSTYRGIKIIKIFDTKVMFNFAGKNVYKYLNITDTSILKKEQR